MLVQGIEINGGLASKTPNNTYFYNFADDWQAHLNDAGLGGAGDGPVFNKITGVVNDIRGWFGLDKLPDQSVNSASAQLSRSNVQQYESDKINSTNRSGLNTDVNPTKTTSYLPLIALFIGGLIVVRLLKK